VVAPSVGGGVIESEVVALAGSIPTRGAAPAAAVAGADARIGAGSEPDAAATGPRLDGVEVVAGDAGAPATSSAVLAATLDDPVDEVTTVLVEVEVEVETAPLDKVLAALV
jgi:hypothetical protein